MKKLMLVLALLAPAALMVSCAKEVPQKAAAVPEYQKWTMIREQKTSLPLARPDSLALRGFVIKLFVEKPNDGDSNWVEEISLSNNVFLKAAGKGNEDYEGPRVFQLLVDGQWFKGEPGVLPELYILDYVALFEKGEMKGIRMVMKTADGKKVETTVVP